MCGRSLAGIVFSRFAIFSMLRRAAGRSRSSAGVITSCRCLPMADPYARVTRSRVSWITPTDGATSSGTVAHTCEGVDPSRERVDGGIAVEDADFEVICPGFACSQVRKLAALSRVEPSRVTIRGRLHRHAIDSFAKHPPHGVERKLFLPVNLIGAEPQGTIDDPYRDGSLRLGNDRMLVALFRKGLVGSRQPFVIPGRVLSHGRARRSGDQVLRAFIHDRPPDVHVVQVHMGRGIETHVDDLVMDHEATLPDTSLDPAMELHRLTVHSGLPDHPLCPQHALVTVPSLAIARETGGHEADAPMQAVFLCRLDQLVELGGVIGAAEERVVEPARHQHAATPTSEPAEPHRLGIPRTHDPGW